MIQKASEFISKHFLLFLPQSMPGALEHPWDYVAHFLVSSVGLGILFLILFWIIKVFNVPHRELISGTLAATIIATFGLAKEISDKNLGKQDMAGDMLANTIGITFAALLIFLVINVVKT